MLIVFKSVKILLICCTVFLCGLSFVDLEEEESGALSVEMETKEYSADIHLGNTTDRKTDKERKEIGVGEQVLLTLTGKPLADLIEIEWSLEEGREKYIEMSKGTKGQTMEIRCEMKKDGVCANLYTLKYILFPYNFNYIAGDVFLIILINS